MIIIIIMIENDNNYNNYKDVKDNKDNWMYWCDSEASEEEGWVIELDLTTPVKF